MCEINKKFGHQGDTCINPRGIIKHLSSDVMSFRMSSAIMT